MESNNKTFSEESSKSHRRQKALKALEIAKKIEADKMKAGAKYQKTDNKTYSLKKEENIAIVVEQYKDNEILVNKKLIIQDQEGNWISNVKLTNSEHKAFNSHIQGQ
ncbi:hypothetical protein BZARG_756 [Bizionia argentinensis JUB59]|uniref:Uncharacterized protein n=1 Tax=Bizionia argentinensis JUB59 TaxID=1046627 RepID=G2EB73_9FLAO|nr:hypothetical protein [Bizionia argentinensis]EGV44390.1 hypothetical protein BZARG_756 [Bizionia argentinensis JUB59]